MSHKIENNKRKFTFADDMKEENMVMGEEEK